MTSYEAKTDNMFENIEDVKLGQTDHVERASMMGSHQTIAKRNRLICRKVCTSLVLSLVLGGQYTDQRIRIA
jgi:hypothetical protein